MSVSTDYWISEVPESMTSSDQMDERTMTDGFSKLSSQLAEGLAAINGRVDTLVALFERHNERQERTDMRVDRMQEEIRTLDKETSAKIRDLHEKNDASNRVISDLHSKISVHRGVGLALVIIVPVVVSTLVAVITWKVQS